jgi:glucose-6-phosphate 1-epimerase
MHLPSSLQFTHLRADFPVLRVDHPLATGCIALLGGHVMEWQPRGESPVLYLSPEAILAEGTAIRGGVPVCWPWFGPRAGLPSHGLARTRFWQLAVATESDHGVHLELTLSSDPATLQLWPHDFTLRLVVEMGRTLEVSLWMVNKGTEAVEITSALHAYLSVGAIEQTSLTGLEGVSYRDELDQDRVKVQEGPVRFAEEVDRIYLHEGPVRIVDAAWARVLEVSQTGGTGTVVWNPWIEKSRRLADLPDTAFHGFLCVEPGQLADRALQLLPGEAHRLSMRIAVRVLEAAV